MSEKKDVILTPDEKRELYKCIVDYEADTKSYNAYYQLYTVLVEGLDFHCRFPIGDKMSDYDMDVAHGLLVSDLNIDKSEIQITEPDQVALARAVMDIVVILKRYRDVTPWTDREDETIMAQAKEKAEELAALIAKLESIPILADPYQFQYFRQICCQK